MIKNDWRSYVPIFLPLLWIPITIGATLFFLPNGFHPLSSSRPWALGAFQFFAGIIFLGVAFSLYGCWRLRGSARLVAALVYLLTLPVQLYAVFMLNVMLFGK